MKAWFKEHAFRVVIGGSALDGQREPLVGAIAKRPFRGGDCRAARDAGEGSTSARVSLSGARPGVARA
jgi:hypothetical protein